MSVKPLLNIKDLCAKIATKQILHNINLTIKPGEIHAIMGPNGSGKSTLANILARNPEYEITSGNIRFNDLDLTTTTPDEAALAGLFLSFQYPVAIPGVSNIQLLKAALNANRKHQGKPPLDAVDLLKAAKDNMKLLNMNADLLQRGVNDGFSGGEKKRNEILQLLMLQPKLAILDETDSGLDIDALKVVAKGVKHYHNEDTAVLLITHYQRLLEYIEPDFVHVLANGKILRTGDKQLAHELEQRGYGWLEETV